MADDDPQSTRTLGYAAPTTVTPRGRSLSDRAASFLVRFLVAIGFFYLGVGCLSRARGMVAGYGERNDLLRDGWALVAVGAIFVYLAIRAFGRRMR